MTWMIEFERVFNYGGMQKGQLKGIPWYDVNGDEC